MGTTEKRKASRAKITKSLRVRPSQPQDEHFEEVILSQNASREGVYFLTQQKNYYKGMRLFVTFPYAGPTDPMNCEYVAEVVRVEPQPNGKLGVAIRLLMTMNYGTTPPGSAA